MRMAIVGMGVAGISVIREIWKQLSPLEKKELEIIIFSDKEKFGTGLPFQKDDESLLINQYTETMTIDPDKPRDFSHWVSLTKNLKDLNHTHVPRAWFGEYLKESLEVWLNDLPIKIIYKNVESITRLPGKKFKVQTNEATEVVDFVHLAIGHLAYGDPYQLMEEENYIHHPYPAEKALFFEEESPCVGIIGSRLTALDTLLFVSKYYPKAKLTFFSLDGLFSSVRGNVEGNLLTDEKRANYFSELCDTEETLTLERVKEWFLSIAEDYEVDVKWLWENQGKADLEGMISDFEHLGLLGKFQRLINELKESYPYIWLNLSDEDKHTYKETLERHFLNFKIPIPQQTTKFLLNSLKAGQTQLVSDVKRITRGTEAFSVMLENEEKVTVDYLINATGQRIDLTGNIENQPPLVKQLIGSGIVSAYTYGGVEIAYPSMSARDASGELLDNFKVYGQLTAGIQYGNMNVDLISQSAITGVRSMKDYMRKEKILTN